MLSWEFLLYLLLYKYSLQLQFAMKQMYQQLILGMMLNIVIVLWDSNKQQMQKNYTNYIFVHLQIRFLDRKSLKRFHYKFVELLNMEQHIHEYHEANLVLLKCYLYNNCIQSDMMLDIEHIQLRKNHVYNLVHQTLLEYGKIRKLLELLMMCRRYKQSQNTYFDWTSIRYKEFQ